MHTINRYTAIILLCVGLSQAQFNLQFDYAQFKADSALNLIEFYYSFNTKNFSTINLDSSETISPELIFAFNHAITDSLYLSDTLKSIYKISNGIQGEYKLDIPGVYKVILPEGMFSVSLSLNDAYTSSSVESATEKINIRTFSSDKPELSDIQLASLIERTEEKSIFSKNSLRVLPNVSAAYFSDHPLLQYYVELYNIAERDLNLSTYLLSSNSEVVYVKHKSISSINSSIVHVDQTSLLKYPSEVYTLQLILSDSTNDYAFMTQKKFYFYNKLYTDTSSVATVQKPGVANRFSEYSEEECDYLFDLSKYIATNQEIDQYEKLNSVEAKQRFLNKFWNNRRSGFSSNLVSFDGFMQRVDFSNQRFDEIGKEGYQTERGRIYITYGEPDRIDYFPNEPNLKPYEIWFYDRIEGGVIFVFGDLSGFSQYELLHSNKRGEVFDESWQRRLIIN